MSALVGATPGVLQSPSRLGSLRALHALLPPRLFAVASPLILLPKTIPI